MSAANPKWVFWMYHLPLYLYQSSLKLQQAVMVGDVVAVVQQLRLTVATLMLMCWSAALLYPRSGASSGKLVAALRETYEVTAADR